MHINDKIWGEWEIEDPLLIELIGSKPFQRLKDISNDGANSFLFDIGKPTRYEHSLGVLYVTMQFSKKQEDHAMAVLHDIAHTAFSHVVDFVFGKGDTQDIHEEVKMEVLEDSEIKTILKKYDYETKEFYEKEDFPIVGGGKNIMNADRIDYYMRDGFGIKSISRDQIEFYVNNLMYDEDLEKLYFENERIAGSFALACLNTSRLAYLSANSVGSYYLLSHALKRAVEIELITKEDLIKGTDKSILPILETSEDEKLQGYFSRLNRDTQFEYCDEEKAEHSTKNKVRYVDPLIKLENGEFANATERVSNLEELLESLKVQYSSVHIRQLQ